MTENEAIEIIWERHRDCEDYRLQFDSYPDGYDFEFDQAILIAAQALEEIQQYREMGRKLRTVYGDCDGLLATAVEGLCKHPGVNIGKPIKARLLVDEDVDKWDAYREIGTVEECREARDKMLPRNPVVAYDIMVGRDDDGNPIWMNEYACPECGLGIEGEYICCPYCGTYINWDEVK